MQLLILCAPVWLRSSRLNQICAPPRRSDPRGVVDRRRPPHVVGEFALELGDERRILLVARVLLLQFAERADQRLGDEHATVRAEMAAGVGQVVREVRHLHAALPR
jgi:hypothetical protein